MPLVPYKLDPGFDTPQHAVLDPPQPEERGGGLFQFGANWQNMVEDFQNAPKVWGAAFELESDIVNGFQLMTRPSFTADPNFNLEANLKEAELWDDYRWNFVGVQSPAEFLYKARKIRREEEARKVLGASGAEGVVASMAAGLISPTTLLPFVGAGAKGMKAVGIGMTLGGLGGLAQEVPLQLNQDLRTMAESGISVGFSTIVGGVLGGGIGYLNRRLEDVADGMAVAKPGRAIPNSEEQRILATRRMDEIDKAVANPKPDEDMGALITERMQLEGRLRELDDMERQAVQAKAIDDEISTSALGNKAAGGADVRDAGAGGLKNMLGIGERLTTLAGPVTAVLGQKISKVGRQMMAELSTAGLRLEGNSILDREGNIIGGLPSNQGGTVESLINSRRGDTLGKIDEAYQSYSDYFFGKDVSAGPFRNSRAATLGRATGKSAGKLNRRQFFEEVGKAMWQGDKHAIPEVERVAQSFRQYYDELLTEAQDLELIPADIKAVAPDMSFLNRVYDTEAIKRNPLKFQKLLADHFSNALQADLNRIHQQFIKGDARDTQRLLDMDMPLAEAQKLRQQFLAELKALNEADDDDLKGIEELISKNRASLADNTRARRQAEAALENGTTTQRRAAKAVVERLAAEREDLRNQIEQLKELGGADLEARRLHKAELKSRIRGLNRSRFMVEEKARAKYDKISDLEDQSIEALERLMYQGHRALQRGENEADAFAADLARMRSNLQAATAKAAGYEAQVQQLEDSVNSARNSQSAGEAPKVVPDEDKTLQRLFKKEEQLQKSTERFNEIANDLEAYENINFAEGGRRDAEALIREALTEAAERANKFNTRRAQRIKKLEDQIEKLDAKGWEARRAEIADRIKTRRQKTEELVRNLGGEKYDRDTGTADFSDRAKEIADLAQERILGTNMRLAGFDAMADARGTELARTLSIDSMQLARNGFLVSDAEHLLHVYANTLIPDIEIVRRLGPFAPDGERNFNFQALNEEMRQAQLQHDITVRNSGKPVDEVKLGEEQAAIYREYEVIRRNLDATIRRLRHQWGLPSDPKSLAVRAATTVLALNAWRFLGGTTISSIPDLAKPIMRYGLLRTLRHGWLPMIANWKAMKLTAADARRAFVAVESATADRSFQLTDLMHYARRKSKYEAGLEFATSKLGIVFGFAPWTDLMKTVSAMSFNSKLMDSIDLSLNAVKTGKDRLEAVEFLNSLGLSQSDQMRIWKEMQNGGAQQINGTWVPETAKWTDKVAIRAYRAALNNETSSSIITPGLELPKWINSSPLARVIGNLKSFALASTSKTLMAGLQQRDMAVLSGLTISLALGALSFYLRATMAGGATEERMRNASPEQWVDEALDASGVLGVLSIAQQIGDNIPGVRNVIRPGALASTLQGKSAAGTVRSQASGLIEDTFGPSADLAFTLAQMMTGVDKIDRAQIHRVRSLLPMQNLILVRRLFDQVENAIGDQFNLPGQRR